LAGLSEGKIGVIKVKGFHQISAECVSYLTFHTSPVLFLQESPCTNYVCSIGQDEVLFVWKYVGSTSQNPKTPLISIPSSISYFR